MLARDEVRHVGDAVAFVVADTLEQAKDAAEAVVVEWTPLAHVVDVVAALADGAASVWPQRPGNVAFDFTLSDARKTAEAFRTAAKIVILTVVNQRLIARTLDTRGVVAQ